MREVAFVNSKSFFIFICRERGDDISVTCQSLSHRRGKKSCGLSTTKIDACVIDENTLFLECYFPTEYSSYNKPQGLFELSRQKNTFNSYNLRLFNL